ncbi:hypothetical protein BCR44DRAFT_79949 [Catenaria anguillulae PL171]|uniref:Uncharacterized protein n=1 Tax=Catenaria anguillulae PL171 TaxID=765915 RepID=A0A1Y2HWL7_9FUNG|nr:hypothetical protein BCR44DRAFT_79949 [Catenaria anguillulae PL171]
MVVAFFNTLQMSAASDTGLLLCVYVLLILIVMVTRCLIHGLWANAVREEHAFVLYKKGISLSTRGERLREVSPKLSLQARDTAQLCWILSHASKEEEVVNALRVFGLPVSTRLATTFATVMLAGISSGFQLLVR